MDSPVWNDPHYLKIWMYCLMKASHKKRELLIGNQVVSLEPGQFITGRKSLSDDLNKDMKPKQRQSEISWWRYLNNLSKWEMLNIKKTNKYSVISVNKWCDYQESEQQMNNKRTTDEQQLNTNKNVKNVKNVEKEEDALKTFDENICISSPIVQEQLIDWCNEKGDDYVIASIKLAADHGANSFAYVKKILNEWHQQNLKTVDQVRNYEMSKKRQKAQTIPFKKKASGDIDWENI